MKELIGECIIWTGYIRKTDGYAIYGQSKIYVHRMKYEEKYGKIPDGMQLDHLCRNRSCVNPDHLEPVTQIENRQRSPLLTGKKTHCPHGHEFSKENTYHYKGTKMCKQCRRNRVSEQRHKP